MLKDRENLSSVCPKQLCMSVLLHAQALDLCSVSHWSWDLKKLCIFSKITFCFESVLATSAVEMSLHLFVPNTYGYLSWAKWGCWQAFVSAAKKQISVSTRTIFVHMDNIERMFYRKACMDKELVRRSTADNTVTVWHWVINEKHRKKFTFSTERVCSYSGQILTSIISVWPNLAPSVKKCMPSSFLLSQIFCKCALKSN